MASLYDIGNLTHDLDDKSAKKIEQLYSKELYSSVLKLINEIQEKGYLPHDLWNLKISTLLAMRNFKAALEENDKLLAHFSNNAFDDRLGRIYILEELREYEKALIVLAKLEVDLRNMQDALSIMKKDLVKKMVI